MRERAPPVHLSTDHTVIGLQYGFTRIGEWNIACSQLCGLGHFRMRGMYAIQTQAAYDAWLKEEAAYLTNP
jgi:heme/copper-type cytochrome/quinol oxidase subunit 2